MKKYLGLILAGLMVSTQALADTTWEKCNSNNGGTLVTVGGQTFCKSNGKMNWWSAYAWCKAMDGYMPSMVELCPGKAMVNGSACGQSYSSTWSSTDNPDDSRYVWWYENGKIADNGLISASLNAYCLKEGD